MSTISIPVSVPSPVADCEKLREAFRGWGTKEGLIISIIAHRSAEQRREIRRVYFELFGEELFESFDTELTRKYERAVLLWMLDSEERDAVIAYESLKNWRPGNRALVEIAVARSADELFAAKRAYQARFRRSLEEDVATYTHGEFRKLLVPLVSIYRHEGPEVNAMLAKSEAKAIHDKIKDNKYGDEEIIRIFTTRSKAQLRATFNDYNNEFGNPINKNLMSDPKDDFPATLRAIIRCITCPERYLEKVIRLSINKIETDEEALTRVITTRAEVDMEHIKEAYLKRNGRPLEHAIKKDTHGHYEDFLLALIGHEDA